MSCLSTLQGVVGYGIPLLLEIHATYYSVIVRFESISHTLTGSCSQPRILRDYRRCRRWNSIRSLVLCLVRWISVFSSSFHTDARSVA